MLVRHVMFFKRVHKVYMIHLSVPLYIIIRPHRHYETACCQRVCSVPCLLVCLIRRSVTAKTSQGAICGEDHSSQTMCLMKGVDHSREKQFGACLGPILGIGFAAVMWPLVKLLSTHVIDFYVLYNFIQI